MAEVKFGWAEALAAALSGLTGGNFTNLIAAKEEEEKERAEREAYRAEDTRRYEEERQHRTEREKLEDILRASEFTSGMFAELPENRVVSEEIPLAQGPGGTLTSAPDTNSRVMTGDPGIDQWLTTLAPGNEGAAALMGQGLGRADIRQRERARTEALADAQSLEMIRNGFEITDQDGYQKHVKLMRGYSETEAALSVEALRVQIANGRRALAEQAPADQLKLMSEAGQTIWQRYNAARNQMRLMDPDRVFKREDVLTLLYQARDSALEQYTSAPAQAAIYAAGETIERNFLSRIGDGSVEAALQAPAEPRPSTAPNPLAGTGGAARRAIEGLGGLQFGN